MTEAEFLKSEIAKMDFLQKAFEAYPKLYTTPELAGPVKGLSLEKEKTIRPSWFDKTLTALFLVPAFVAWFILWALVLKDTPVNPVYIALMLIPTAVIGIGIWNGFFNPRYLFTIRLSSKGLSIKADDFLWPQISSTCILRKQQGRTAISYLVVFTKDGQVHQYSLFKFGISNKRLASFLEFYKPKKAA